MLTLSALIGHTGFVGSNISSQVAFTQYFNSKNISEIKNNQYDLVVCSGVSAVKWQANKEPERDRESIEKLLTPLRTIKAKRFVLISTIDVYPSPVNVNEDTPLKNSSNHAYGTHRLMVENFVENNFSNYCILRLPGLFGTGLKKNVIFDLLNQNCLNMINPNSSFQYYHLKHLWNDISICLEHKISLLNVACEPILTKSIVSEFFPDAIIGSQASPEAHYNMQSKHHSIWNQQNRYLYTASQTMRELGEFITSTQRNSL